MHAIEKLLAEKAGKHQVATGEIVNCDVDIAGINDLYLQTVRSFYEMGGEKVFDADKIVMFFDHYAPCATITQAENHKQFRKFCFEQGIEKLMDIDQGVCHQVLADKGWVHPGEIVVVTDSHTTTHGAFGAFGPGVGATDLATTMITGKLWFMVPEIFRINLVGKLQPGVFAKDIILHIIGDLGADYGVYKAVEFAGPVVNGLSISERMCMCNMSTEMGCKTSYIQPDAVTMEYLHNCVARPYKIYETDTDFQYAAELTYDVSKIRAQVAAPSSVDNVFELDKYAGTPVDEAYLGSCTGGRLQDLAVAAQILQGRHIPKTTRMIVVPASKKVMEDAMELGYIQTLMQAGATITAPGCAACLGVHQGMLAGGEVCISSTNRNFPGRMGHVDGRIFLASPAAVAASALEGKITDPAVYLKTGDCEWTVMVMKTKVRGKAFVFGKNIDTDQIYPGRFVEYTDVEDIKKYAMYGADESFVKNFDPGDIIVAGTNFGCGSSREHAAITLKAVGTGAVLAESFGRIFFRNAINLGVPVITCSEITKIIAEGDEVEVDIEAGIIKNLTTGATAAAVPMSPYIMNILQSGGIKPMIKAMQETKKSKNR